MVLSCYGRSSAWLPSPAGGDGDGRGRCIESEKRGWVIDNLNIIDCDVELNFRVSVDWGRWVSNIQSIRILRHFLFDYQTEYAHNNTPNHK